MCWQSCVKRCGVSVNSLVYHVRDSAVCDSVVSYACLSFFLFFIFYFLIQENPWEPFCDVNAVLVVIMYLLYYYDICIIQSKVLNAKGETTSSLAFNFGVPAFMHVRTTVNLYKVMQKWA